MKVLITGAAGFSASHLISDLSCEAGLDLICSDLHGSEASGNCSDLTDYRSVYELLDKRRPEKIYHLAGTFSNDYDTDYRTNVLSTKNILDSCLKLNLRCLILLIGSSAEYGIISESDNPVREDHPLSPVSIYGLTKAYQSHLMRYYHNVYNVDVVMARTFNVMGRGISNKLFIGRVYEQIEEYKSGNVPKIVMGNLQNKRDYIKVGDAVKDYRLIMEKGTAGEIYNVGSGKSIRTRDLLEEILREAGLDMAAVEERCPEQSGKIDIKDIYADITKISSLSL